MTHETLLRISSIILLLPLAGFTGIIFFQKKLGRAAGYIGSSILGINLFLSLLVAYQKLAFFSDAGMLQWKFDWLNLGSHSITIGIGLDNLAAIMLIVVNLISFLVHVFSLEYMREDIRFPRFYAYLGLFTFSMLGIVIANNFLNMYIFWELVGISSYLLIGFWYEKDSAANASKKAFITNRVGDFGFFAGIMILFFTYGSFMFDDIFSHIGEGHIPFDSGTMLTLAGILLFMGAIGKSAQFPLHVWLPDAMEGPTPVSALIHAATMVAAGVYLTARIFPMLTADALLFVAYIGAITAFIAATIAITQTDFKRILAYSTVSQLGYMIMAIGVGAYSYGFFHLVTHAWFKACLFLASGSVIHAMHHSMHHAGEHHMDPQDIRNMGGLRKTMPVTYFTFLFSTIAIAGVPFTSGFLSKDGILAGTMAFGQLSGHWFIAFSGFASAAMTAFYMFRLLISAFHGQPKTHIAAHTHENNKLITVPLIVLSILTFWFFYSFNPFDGGSGWFYQKIKTPATVVQAEHQWGFFVPYESVRSHSAACCGEPTANSATEPSHNHHKEAHHALNKYEEALHHAHLPAMIISLIIAGLGIFLSFSFYQFKIFNPDGVAELIRPFYLLSYNKWYFDEIYDASVIWGTTTFAKILALFDLYIIDGIVNLVGWFTKLVGHFIGWFDLYVIDGLVNLTANVTAFFGLVFRKFQTGRIQAYIVMTIIFAMVLLYYVL